MNALCSLQTKHEGKTLFAAFQPLLPMVCPLFVEKICSMHIKNELFQMSSASRKRAESKDEHEYLNIPDSKCKVCYSIKFGLKLHLRVI